MAKIYISSIAAVSANNVIGRDNRLIWHIPEDLKFFKRATMGKPIIMGRKSYESLGKPLPGRPNIIISRSSKNFKSGPATEHFKGMESVGGTTAKINEGPFTYGSIDEAITAAKDMAGKMNIDEIFITGGGEIYKQTMSIIDRLYLTRVEKNYDGDTYFPALNPHEWKTISKEHHDGNPAFTFYVLERA